MARKFLVPVGLVKLTTVQRDALGVVGSGSLIFNTTTLNTEVYNGTVWSSGGGASNLTDLNDTPSALGTAGQILEIDSAGTNTQWTTPLSFDTYIKAGLMGFFSDVIPAGVKLIFMVLEEEIIFEANAPQSKIKALLAPSSNLALDIRRRTSVGSDTSIGSINFVSGVNDATVTMSAVTIPINDMIYINAPADIYGTEDLFINLIGKSLIPVY